MPSYFVWDSRVGAWRTAALSHLCFREDAAVYSLRLADTAEQFFLPPTLPPVLPPLRVDQQAAIEGHTNHLGLASAAEITRDLIDALAVAGRHSLQPVGSQPGIEFDGGAARDLICYRIRNENLRVQLTEQLQAPDPGEVDQGRGVADRRHGSSDSSSSSSSSAVVWIVGIR